LCLDWSKQSDNWIVTGGQDKNAHIWDSNTGQNICKIERHTEAIHGACFSHDDRKLVTMGTDKLIIVWELLVDPNMPLVPKAHELFRFSTRYYEDLALSRTHLISVHQSKAKIYNFWSGKQSDNMVLD